MTTLRLDIYVDDDYDAACADLVIGTDVTAHPTGVFAAGGNPEYEFTGSAAHLGAVAARYAGDDDTELRGLLDRIEADSHDDELVDPEMARTLVGS